MKGIQVYSNKGPRGDKNKNIKIGWGHLKILPKFNQTWHKSFLGEGIQVCSNEGDSLSPRGDNSKREVYTEKFKKSSSPEPAGQNQSNLVQIILG
jgi:hypothetical protein